MKANSLTIFPKENSSDEYLWSCLKNGDRKALDEIYYGHVPALIAYGHQFTAKKELVDDCIQELFIDLWQKRNRLGETSSIRFYLIKSIKRRILRQIKKSDKCKAFSEFNEFFIENQMDTNISNESEVIVSTQKLRRSFQALSPLQRELIYLKYYNNLDCDQMKDVLDLTKKQVYNALSKAMISLRQSLVVN
ncbi:RNA polymerase sigma factor [Marinigracilibium pacificum]|uniref:Sigma-70 family RNA polymerase sigma factor n=1 Tax=Marinigracilibium pacificum TaxID=2729599 RepID=A0A848IWB9_9BACT|nr:sigma-70 family RNA polymerase sigma factor [Marinigracilibium pacificum]NMM47551.1 sigma-70 family RNA polymerase sigma factor [Marinigracilibium pacificum]